MTRAKTALTIAGSDPSGGAGIQADIKTMCAFGVYGSSAVTAITAQNTMGVTRVFGLPPDLVTDQIDAVMDDIGADAVKTGMLPSSEVVGAVADAVDRHAITTLVVDPVMLSGTGDRLIEAGAEEAVSELMVPRAFLVTPNLHEAERLSGVTITDTDGMLEAARVIHERGAANVLVKGGHLPTGAVDLLFDGTGSRTFSGERFEGGDVHGTGCALSAAIAACLALGLDLDEAVSRAKAYVSRGIAESLVVGKGARAVNHLAGRSEE